MKTKLLFGLFLLATLQFTNAQNAIIGLVGEYSSWGNDDLLTTTDGVNYSLSAWVFPGSNGSNPNEIKFRENQDWNHRAWGRTVGSTTGWPSGTGNVAGGSANIVAVVGTWDVSFNINTGAYSFTQSTLAVDDFTKNIQFYYVNNALNINGYSGKASIKAYDIIGRLLYQKENVSVQNGFSQTIKLPENQVSIILIKGDNFSKSLEVIAHQ